MVADLPSGQQPKRKRFGRQRSVSRSCTDCGCRRCRKSREWSSKRHATATKQKCTLPPSGGIETTHAVDKSVAAAAARLAAGNAAPYKAKVWAYRHLAANFISCDIDGVNRSGESITFKIGGEHDFHEFEPTVPDAAEALHMIGLLARRVGAEVQVGR